MYFFSAAFHLYRCRSSGAPASSRQRHAAGLKAWMAGAPFRLFLSWSGVSWPQGRQWWMSLIWPRSSSTCSSPCAPTTPAGDTSYAFFSFFCCRIFFIYFLLLWCHVCSLRDQDNAIIRPLPKIKRLISDNSCLSHIVQVVTLHLCISDWLNNQTWCFWCWWSIIIFFSALPTAAVDLWPHPGRKSGQCFVLGDAGQPQSAAPLFERSLLLHHDVHGLQCASCSKVKKNIKEKDLLVTLKLLKNSVNDFI